MNKRRNKAAMFRLKHGRTSVDLGGLAAEGDAELEKYYVQRHKYVDRALSIEDKASFFVGGKGTGKSAILQMVRLIAKSQNQYKLINLSPTQLAFSALANTDIASPILTDPEKKQWLYKSLWGYILSTEIGCMEYPDESNFTALIKNLFRGRDESMLRSLLKLRYDERGNVESLSSRFLKIIKEVEIAGKVGITGVELGTKFHTTSERQESKLNQFSLLGMIHDVSCKIADLIENKYIVLIDDLDVDWHGNNPVQNDLLAALFSSIKQVCRPPKIKAVVSIQDRILKELPIEHKDKFRDAICQVEWDMDSIKEMLEKRIRHIFNIAPGEIWTDLFAQDSFRYIWKRIYARPREAIRLTSLCLERARLNGNRKVDSTDMNTAFKQFSVERLEDIGSELEYTHPSFVKFIRNFSGYPREFPLCEIKGVIETAIIRELDNQTDVSKWIYRYENDAQSLVQLLLENNIILYKSGRKDEPQVFDPSSHDLSNGNAFVSFHPMYCAGLGIAIS